MEYYHVLIGFWLYDKYDNYREDSLLNLTQSDLEEHILDPLNNLSQHSITLSGNFIQKGLIESVVILQTDATVFEDFNWKERTYLNDNWKDQKALDLSYKYANKLKLLQSSSEDESRQVVPSSLEITEKKEKNKKIFIVHGHDDILLDAITGFIKLLDLQPIVLKDQTSSSYSFLYEKFEAEAKDCGFAIALMSPDDEVATRKENVEQFRARQNVIFELGYFAGKLGINSTAVILHNKKQEVDMLSDLQGLVYISTKVDWKQELSEKLKAAGYPIDESKLK